MMWLYFSAAVFLFGSEIAASIRDASQATGEKPSDFSPQKQSPIR
jgi:membrane protein